MNRLLRDYIRIAQRNGLSYMGLDGRQHHMFGRDDRVLVRAAGTPRNASIAVIYFEQECVKASEKPSPTAAKPVTIDGNAAFRQLDERKHG